MKKDNSTPSKSPINKSSINRSLVMLIFVICGLATLYFAFQVSDTQEMNVQDIRASIKEKMSHIRDHKHDEKPICKSQNKEFAAEWQDVMTQYYKGQRIGKSIKALAEKTEDKDLQISLAKFYKKFADFERSEVAVYSDFVALEQRLFHEQQTVTLGGYLGKYLNEFVKIKRAKYSSDMSGTFQKIKDLMSHNDFDNSLLLVEDLRNSCQCFDEKEYKSLLTLVEADSSVKKLDKLVNQ